MSENNEFTFENEQYRKTYWHTCSHVLAQAVKRLHPEVKLAIGPAIDNGFYYDFDAPFTFTPEMLDEVVALGRADSVMPDSAMLEKSRPLIATIVKGLIARDLFESTDYFRVVNPALSPSYRAALDLINDEERYNREGAVPSK